MARSLAESWWSRRGEPPTLLEAGAGAGGRVVSAGLLAARLVGLDFFSATKKHMELSDHVKAQAKI